jgi:hypothetical protein
MVKLFLCIITLIILQACAHEEKKPKLNAKEVLELAYEVNTNFGFSKDTILVGYGGGKESNGTNWPISGLYKPFSDSFYKDEKLYINRTLGDNAFTKIMKEKSIYIDDIYINRFRYDLIAYDFNIFSPEGGAIEDSFNIYMPGGGAIANIILNKPGVVGDTASLIYKFSKKENVQALKAYKNYWIYLTYDTIHKTFLNILNTKTKEKCQIITDSLIGPANFLLFDIMNDEKPEIILFQTPAYLFKFSGLLKVFRIVE